MSKHYVLLIKNGCFLTAFLFSFLFFNTTFSQQGFGTHFWNVNCYNMSNTGGTDADRLSWLQNLTNVTYRGYYTENRVSFETISRWGIGSNPGTANGLTGTAYVNVNGGVNNDHHVIVARRRGFPYGNYTIGTSYDDMVVLRINGTEVWNSGTTLTGTNNSVWTGILDENSEVEMRFREVGGDSYVSFYFNRNAINNGTNTTLTPNTYISLVDQGLSARPGNLNGQYDVNINGYIALTRQANARLYINGWTYMEHNGTAYDYVRIFDGIGTGGTQLVQYLGNQYNARNYTGNYGQNLTVQFVSDVSQVRPGFLFDVTQVGISSFTPDNLCAGGTITLTGIGFRATRPNGVTINGVNVPYTVNSDTQITVSPNTALTGIITVDTYYGIAVSSGTVSVSGGPISSVTAIQSSSNLCSGPSTLSAVSPQPVAHYPFNGNLNDISGNNLHLSVVSGPANYSEGGLVLSGAGAMRFESAANSLLSGAVHYTIEFDMKMTADNGEYGKIFTWAPAGERSPGIFHYKFAPGLHWRHDSDAAPCCGAGGNQGVDYGLSIGQWYHVVGVRKGTTFTLYIDGVQVEQATNLASDTRMGSAPFVFGAFPGNNAPQGTIIKNFKIFNNSFDWYSGSCGGTYISSLPEVTVNPATTTTYYLRAENTCGVSPCTPIIVSREPIPAVPNVSASNPAFCSPNNTNLEAHGLAPGGQVFQGNGSNAAIEVMQDVPEQNFTIEMWVRTAAANTGIFSVAELNLGAGGHDRHFYVSGGMLWIRVWMGAEWNTNYPISDNQWHHLALTTQTGVGQKVYVDGALIATFPYDVSDFNWQDRFYIGYSNDAGANGFLTGQIDNVRIWNTVRTQAQIIANMHLETPVSTAGLVSHLALNGNAIASTGPSGTATNPTWATPNYYTYTWSGGPNLPAPATAEVQTTGSITLAGTHNYAVTATAGSCPGTISANVPVVVSNPSIAPTDITAVHPSHPDYCHGNTITLTQSGGTPAGGGVVDVWYAASGETTPSVASCENESFIELWNGFQYSSTCLGIKNTDYSINNGILSVETVNNVDGGNDPWIGMYPFPNSFSYDLSDYPYVNVRYRVTQTAVAGSQYPNNMAIFGIEADRPVVSVCNNSLGIVRVKPINNDGNWHVVSFDMPTGVGMGGDIVGWRFDYTNNNSQALGTRMEIDFIIASKHPMVEEGTVLTLSPGDEYYPTQTTTYYAKKIDDCGATSCEAETVVLPAVSNQLALNNESAVCSINANETVHFFEPVTGNYIASVTAGATGLGSTTATVYDEGTPLMTYADCQVTGLETAVLERHWVITPGTNVAATVTLPYYVTEFNALVGLTALSNSPDDNLTAGAYGALGLSKYSGPANVDNLWNNNCPSPYSTGNGGTTWQPSNFVGTLNGEIPGWPVNTDRYSRFSIAGFSEFWLHASDPHITPLSVQLSDFSASCETRTITWTTLSEQNSSHFVVEQSRDGYNWEVIATVSGSGTTNSANTYTVNNNLAADYYRLKQVDFDGKFDYYGPVHVDCGSSNNNALTVYPNPNNGTFTVAISSSESMGESTVFIHDVSGKVVAMRDVNVLSGTNTVHFENNNLMPGTYIVSVQGKDKNTLVPVRLVIQ